MKKQGTAKMGRKSSDAKVTPSKNWVGRDEEIYYLKSILSAGRHCLLEGPVGSGKTALALHVLITQGLGFVRVDGDSRYSEQKLTGWYDPPTVFKYGYTPKAFIAGPLVQAMQSGLVLFINELNRMPEGVQNILLPALDEGLIDVPKFGKIQAKEGFRVIATQNPKEFVATSHLSEALMDRFEWLYIDYQSYEEELNIVRTSIANHFLKKGDFEKVVEASVILVRITREHESVRRGASIRAAIAIAQLTSTLAEKLNIEQAFLKAVEISLQNRIEIERAELEEKSEIELMREFATKAWKLEKPSEEGKKKKF